MEAAGRCFAGPSWGCWSALGNKTRVSPALLSCFAVHGQGRQRFSALLYHHLPLPEMEDRNGDTTCKCSLSAVSCQPDPRKNLPHIFREGLISVASTYGSTSAGALITSRPREANGTTRISLGPKQKSHSLPQSSSAAPPFQKGLRGRGTEYPHCHLVSLGQKWLSARACNSSISHICPITDQ